MKEKDKFGLKAPMEITFYGTRGSVPAPLTEQDVRAKVKGAVQEAFADAKAGAIPSTDAALESWINNLPFNLRGTFGGNTTCCHVKCGPTDFVLDMGTGFRLFGQKIVPRMFAAKEPKDRGLPIYLLMSHVHWDHVQGFPFFGPLYVPPQLLPENRLIFFGGLDWQKTLQEVLRGQMDPPVFPVELPKIEKEGPAMEFHSIWNDFERFLPLGSNDIFHWRVKVKAVRLHHPNETYGWRLEYQNKVFVFATDTEPFACGPDPALVGLAKDADILYLDGQFSRAQFCGLKEAEGVPRLGWGHGYDEWCGEVAQAANVKMLVLGHHDPAASDLAIMRIVENTKSIFPNTIAAYDTMKLTLAV